MTMISDLFQDEVEEILSRVPITSRRTVRSTCKGWNLLFDDKSFTKKHCAQAAAKERMAIMLYDSRACLIRIDLHNHKGLVGSSIKETGNFSSRINQICGVCDGLVLCIVKDNTKRRLEVWNPYLGQVRWIGTLYSFNALDRFAIGYDQKDNNHKILMAKFDYGDPSVMHKSVDYKIYSFKSKSWKVITDTCHWYVYDELKGVSFKGNTYFIAYDRSKLWTESFFSFDFTEERFGPPLDLPFCYSPFCDSPSDHVLILSTIREEQLVLLRQRGATDEIEIWITTKIEPGAVSWRTLLVAMKPSTEGSFFTFLVDDKKKTAVISYVEESNHGREIKAYLIGEDRNYKVVDFGKSVYRPSGCSYVPSPVQIQ